MRSLPAFVLPVSILALIMAQSAFTVSDLFITHTALLLPLIPLAAGLAFGAAWRGHVGAPSLRSPEGLLRVVVPALALLALLSWVGSDVSTTRRYHRILAVSGGYGAHSDASARLAAYLDEKGYASPAVLDWGLDAPLRFLTAGRVTPIEVFGYERLEAPDAGFDDRMQDFLADSSTVYIGPAPGKAVFRGRMEAMAELADRQGRYWLQEAWFFQRSGELLFIIYRTIPK